MKGGWRSLFLLHKQRFIAKTFRCEGYERAHYSRINIIIQHQSEREYYERKINKKLITTYKDDENDPDSDMTVFKCLTLVL